MLRARRCAGAGLLIAALASGLVATNTTSSAVSGPADAGGAEYVDGEILVGFQPGTPPETVAETLGALAGQSTDTIGHDGHVLEVAPAQVDEAIAALRSRPEVLYAEPNLVLTATATPDDLRYAELYGMEKIAAPQAWDVETGDASVVVGVLDTGIDATHPDLADNMWHNTAGLWGCPAATTGWDSINSDCNPTDDHYHGTHVSGTIGGVGNNGMGVAGVSWDVELMGLKVLNQNGSGSVDQIVNGIDRAIEAKQNGVNLRVLSASLGGNGTSTALALAVDRAEAAGIIFVAAAGNNGLNVDASPVSPCIYATLCVAATDQNDARAGFSNFGATTVDIAAPGVATLSTLPNNSYGTLSGTSMATPHVSGAIALLAQSDACRTKAAWELTDLVLAGADTIGNIGIDGNRRMNIGNSMMTCADPQYFSVKANPAAAAVDSGSIATTTISASSADPAQTLTLSASGLPAGATASFEPASLTTGSISTLTIATTPETESGIYAITVAAVGATVRTATYTLTVVAPPAVLTNGVPVTAAGTVGSEQFWALDVPAGQASLTFTTSGGSGDADLYVRRGSRPTLAAFDCRPYLNGNTETCTFNNPAAGTWYVMLRGYAGYGGITLVGNYYAAAPSDFSIGVWPHAGTALAGSSLTTTVSTATTMGIPQTIALTATGLPSGATASFVPASVTSGASATMKVTTSADTPVGTYEVTVTGTGGVSHSVPFLLEVTVPTSTPLANGMPVTAGGAPGSMQFWTLDVPAGQPSLTFGINGGLGDADLYVRHGSLPTLTTFDCRPYLGGNTETCTFDDPAAGTWHVMVRGYTSYSGVSLTGTYAGILVNNKYVKQLAGPAGSQKYWKLTVPPGQRKVTFNSYNGNGNVDLYVQFGQIPSTTSFLCKSTNPTNNTEKCTIEAPAPGDYYVMLYGTTAYDHVLMRGVYTNTN